MCGSLIIMHKCQTLGDQNSDKIVSLQFIILYWRKVIISGNFVHSPRYHNSTSAINMDIIFINNRPFIQSHLQWKRTYSLQTVPLVQERLNPFKSCRLSTDTFIMLALESLISADIKKETFLYLKLKVVFWWS